MLVKACSVIFKRFSLYFLAFSTMFVDCQTPTVVFASGFLWDFPQGNLLKLLEEFSLNLRSLMAHQRHSVLLRSRGTLQKLLDFFATSNAFLQKGVLSFASNSFHFFVKLYVTTFFV